MATCTWFMNGYNMHCLKECGIAMGLFFMNEHTDMRTGCIIRMQFKYIQAWPWAVGTLGYTSSGWAGSCCSLHAGCSIVCMLMYLSLVRMFNVSVCCCMYIWCT